MLIKRFKSKGPVWRIWGTRHPTPSYWVPVLRQGAPTPSHTLIYLICSMFFGEISITLKPKAQFIGCNLISVYHRYKDCEHSLQAWRVISSIYILLEKRLWQSLPHLCLTRGPWSMSIWEDIRIIWDANRTRVNLEQHTQPAGSTACVPGISEW